MSSTFIADAVLFDMDGTLTDSIQAVEAAWGKVAKDIKQDPAHVIAATHGKRAVDNLSQFRPEIKKHEMEDEVQDFEESILYFADAYTTHGRGSRRQSQSGTPIISSPIASGSNTPALTTGTSGGSSAPPSRSNSMASTGRRPSFAQRLQSKLAMSAVPESRPKVVANPLTDDSAIADDDDDEYDPSIVLMESEDGTLTKHRLEAWQVEAGAVDRGVRILPGVKKMIASLPEGRYAVATSGARTYAFGCMTRVGITPPPVTITADDKRLKAGKPAPDPFLLAASELGYDAKNCVVFEDSPSGIKAGVASGATVIAVCTSHDRAKIENCGAHYLVENMEKVHVKVLEDGRLEFTVDA